MKRRKSIVGLASALLILMSITALVLAFAMVPDIWQPTNSTWVNGNASGYTEGEVVPVRLMLDGTEGETDDVHVCLDLDLSQTGAIAFTDVAPWDTTYLPTVQPPDPNNLSALVLNAFQIENGTINNASFLGESDGTAGFECFEDYQEWRVNVTLGNDGDATPGEDYDATTLVFGAVIAQPGAPIASGGSVPAGLGASAANGVIQMQFSSEGRETIQLRGSSITPADPELTVTKTPSPTEVYPGGSVTYTVNVENTGNVTLMVDSLIDSVFGDVTMVQGDVTATTCDLTPPVELPPGEDYECTFTATVDGTPGTTHSNTVEACDTSFDPDVCDEGSADVDIVEPPAPAIEVTKTADPTEVTEPGGDVTFTVVVENTGNVNVFIDYLYDDKFFNLDGQGTCDVFPPVELAPTETYTCSFTEMVSGTAGDTHTNTVEACDGSTFQDPVCDRDNATVTVVPPPPAPAIDVTKTASPTEVTEPGGDVTFTIVVENTGNVPVFIDSLVDDIYGDLQGVGTCDVDPAVELAPTETYTCSFTETVSGFAGIVHTNTATACDTASFEGDICDSDTATVTIVPALGVCPVDAAVYERTDLIGQGMGSNAKAVGVRKVLIPNSADVLELYGQLAGKDQRSWKYARFIRPNGTYINDKSLESPAYRQWAVFWYGEYLTPSTLPHWRARLIGAPTKAPFVQRAFILYPTYRTTEQYVNVWETFDESAENHVYWEDFNGWIPEQQQVLEIPAPQQTVDLVVKVAVVDNDKDARPFELTISAGGVSQFVSLNGPTNGDLLNIVEVTLQGVPAGTDEVVLDLVSPAEIGDSVAMVGATAHYLCVPSEVPNDDN